MLKRLLIYLWVFFICGCEDVRLTLPCKANCEGGETQVPETEPTHSEANPIPLSKPKTTPLPQISPNPVPSLSPLPSPSSIPSPSPTSKPSSTPSPTPPSLSLDFSTYLGGNQEELIRDIKTDAFGRIYVVGSTRSPLFPTTPGAYDRTHNGKEDVFILILDPTGQTILRSTFYGSSEFQRAYNIELDAQGNVYISGRSGSGLPVTPGTFQPFFSGAPDVGNDGVTDAFIAKFSPDLSQLHWATYWGTLANTGAKDDYTRIIRGMAIDAAGDLYLSAGHNEGQYAASIQSVLLNQPNPGSNGVVAKIKGDGSQVLWMRFAGDTMQSDVEVDLSNGDVVFANMTKQPGLPTSANAFSQSYQGGFDLYIIRLGNNGAFKKGTYYGGSVDEHIEKNLLALDTQGNIVLAIGTQSNDLPMPPGSYDPTFNGLGGNGLGNQSNYNGDVAVVKFSSDLSRLLGATYLGGRYGDGPEGVAIDALGNIYVGGGTYSDNFVTTHDAFQPQLGGNIGNGNVDAFLTKLSPDLSTVLYSTYAGGEEEDYIRTVTIDTSGRVLGAGQSRSPDFPVKNALQPNLSGLWDGVVLRWNE